MANLPFIKNIEQERSQIITYFNFVFKLLCHLQSKILFQNCHDYNDMITM